MIGSQGANRSLSLQLGEGVQQHVLIAGKTGSGKSTLLHSIITSGAHHYHPDQLAFYLFDFKKGVEFKPYADIGLPHARVIGIESEREFGRSVLQRLDEELQQRGEKFRAAGVQELGDYREATGESLPRIMLVVDEFQELFVRDDRLAGDCSMLLIGSFAKVARSGCTWCLSSQSLGRRLFAAARDAGTDGRSHRDAVQRSGRRPDLVRRQHRGTIDQPSRRGDLQ